VGGWELLDCAGKEEARAVMKAAELAARVKGAKQSKAVATERAADMGLGRMGTRSTA
jgi:hypothetical protein